MFRFRLERMLSLVKTQEESKRLEVSATRKRIASFKEKQCALIEESKALLGIQSQGERDKELFRNQKIESNKWQVELYVERIREENRSLDEQLTDLMHLVKRRRALESLKGKREAEYRRESNLKEQKRAEEIFRMVRQPTRD